jgi:NAD-dependent DNA ligase
MIDGVVISFTDPAKIQMLGRVNSVNKWSMAIKFNPRKARTIFLGYTFSIGKSGDVIPMVHFKPCEFIGGIHTKQTIHSYERFKTLNLAIGDEIDIEYINDVISYVTKPDTAYNRQKRVPERFIDYCPYCGTKIVISDSGKSAKCPNSDCHERKIMRMVDMLDRLGFKDIAEESVRALDLTEFKDLINLTFEKASILGPNTAAKFISDIRALFVTPIADYKIMSAFSFEGMADEKWKVILAYYSITELLAYHYSHNLSAVIEHIPGVGPKTIKAIIVGFIDYADDIDFVVKNMNIINLNSVVSKPRVAISGFRDPEFIDLINNYGFDASDKYTVNKNTKALIVADPSAKSTKIVNAMKYNIPIYTKDSFLAANNIFIQ